jgi:MFS transporter, PHS family, inorganic phosphate transporter
VQIYPAEVFPTKFKATAHGLSAACGKAGAIISALAFNQLTNSIGTPNVLWSASPFPLSLCFLSC